jgi:hypothetical protein
MLGKITLFTMVVVNAHIAVMPCSIAEPREVARDQGLTVFESVVDRAGGGTGTILVARIDPIRRPYEW